VAGTYAAGTDVSTDRSMAEIRATLRRYGAEQVLWGEGDDRAMVWFMMSGRQVKIAVPMPDRNSREFTHTPERGKQRTALQRDAAWEQAVKQRWRALNLVIKAKLEAVQAGISTFDTEFLGHLVLPGGQTVGDAVRDDIDHAYATNTMPALLPALKALER
jgi:hypothetical protein